VHCVIWIVKVVLVDGGVWLWCEVVSFFFF